MRRGAPRERLAATLSADVGLTEDEARERRARYGDNDIVELARNPWLDLLRDTAKDPMLWFLALTGGIYLWLGERIEAVTLLFAVVPLAGMDALLHRRTQASVEGLSGTLASRARVVRGGAVALVPAAELVPGDLVIVGPGQPFPADGLIVAGAELQADESALTGESLPARKRPLVELPSDDEVEIVGVHWGFAGTRLLTGEARARIAFTGRDTMYGEIVHLAIGGARARTPLQRSISHLVAALLVAAGALCVVLAVVRLRQGQGWLDAFVSAVTLAVAALPEEFPVVFTVFLGVGVHRLARKKALVRRAVSVENIGRVSVICSDKTGTLTEGRLAVAAAMPAAGAREDDVVETAARASRRDSNDPLDQAIFDEADRRGESRSEGEVVATFPFTEGRRRETRIFRVDGAGLVAAVKGSPETVLALSSLADDARARWLAKVEEVAAAGFKVVACARRPLSLDEPVLEPRGELSFVGLLACADSIRPGVVDAVARCRRDGVRVVMVTGDHPSAARSIGRQIGLGGGGEPKILSGERLERLLQDGEPNALRDVDVVARALPAQKLGLVRALQGQGEIVAVTGDGVNDVPALQAADVGIAMGQRGTRSAREVAAIVLSDDNFRSIADAIAEGRQLFENLQRSFAYLLLIHIPLVVTATLIPLAGYPLLYLPIHIVWLEAIIHPSAILAFQRATPGRRTSPRRRVDARFFERSEWGAIGVSGVLGTTAVAWTYARSLGPLTDVEHARAMALIVLAVLSATVLVVLSQLGTRASRWIVGGTLFSTLLFVQVAPLARVLHLEPLHLDDWLLAIASALLAAAPVLVLVRPQRRGARRSGAHPVDAARR